MDIKLDIAGILSSIMWPLVILVTLLAYRGELPKLMQSLLGRLKKVELPWLSLELTMVQAFAPDLAGGPLSVDLRQGSVAAVFSSSFSQGIMAPFEQQGSADYAEVNLGAGKEWLSSRIFIMSILFARLKGARSIAFLETSGGTRRRFVGYANCEDVRWALARIHPWLENAYSHAYATINGPVQNHIALVPDPGKAKHAISSEDSTSAISLLNAFLQSVQSGPPQWPVVGNQNYASEDWVQIKSNPQDPVTFEHALWITGEGIRDILGDQMYTTAFISTDFSSKDRAMQMRLLAAADGPFIAITDSSGKLEGLADREAALARLVSEMAGVIGITN